MGALEQHDDDPLRPGAVIAAKYRLVEPCGAGGMGSVWRADHVSLGNAVAIKFLHGSIARARESRARFEREARFSAKLGDESMHVVRVTDHGVTEHGRPFLVMELLKGESLGERLERDGRLALPLASAITTQLCRALHVAHVAGIVHRDLKPANVFLCRGGPPEADGLLVKLLDFGVAKATLEMDAQPVTRAGFIVGTPAYMSPEQITGEKYVDARADLWAVAAIVYRMAVGAPPFGNGQISELGLRITTRAPLPPSQLAGDLPPELDDWIAHGLAKKPDERFQTTTDLADALAAIARLPAGTGARSVVRLAEDGPTRADAPGGDVATTLPDPSQTSAPRTLRPSMPSAEWKPPRSSTVPIVLGLLVLAGAVTAAAVLLGGRKGAAPTPEPATPSISVAPSAPRDPFVPNAPAPSASASASSSPTATATHARPRPSTLASPPTAPTPTPTTAPTITPTTAPTITPTTTPTTATTTTPTTTPTAAGVDAAPKVDEKF